MNFENSNMSIAEQISLENAKALQEKVETQNLLIQYLAEMTDVYIPQEEEGGVQNVSNIEEIEE